MEWRVRSTVTLSLSPEPLVGRKLMVSSGLPVTSTVTTRYPYSRKGPAARV